MCVCVCACVCVHMMHTLTHTHSLSHTHNTHCWTQTLWKKMKLQGRRVGWVTQGGGGTLRTVAGVGRRRSWQSEMRRLVLVSVCFCTFPFFFWPLAFKLWLQVVAMRACMHVHAYMRVYTCIYASTYMHICVYIHACMRVHTCIYACTHMHICVYIHAYVRNTRAHARMCPRLHQMK